MIASAFYIWLRASALMTALMILFGGVPFLVDGVRWLLKTRVVRKPRVPESQRVVE